MRLLALFAAGLFAGPVTAEDKIDPAKLVGTWKATRYAGEVPKTPMTFEFAKGGEVVMRVGEGKDASKRDGTYTVKGSAVEIAYKGGPGAVDTLDILKLTDAVLHVRPASDPKAAATELERVKVVKPGADAEAILGTWKADKVDAGGEGGRGVEAAARMRITFRKDGKFVMAVPDGKDREGTYTLDPAAQPKAIDLTADDRPTALGLYALDGDTLTLVTGESGGKTRPTEFKAEGKKGTFVTTFTRVKDEPKKDK